MRARSFAFAALVLAQTQTAAAVATAGPFSRGGHGDRVVVAESRFGNGVVAGPVRWQRLGPQVRLPGGTWVYCRRSCAETLRVETVDFWEAKGLGGGTFDNECGIFGCLEVRWPR